LDRSPKTNKKNKRVVRLSLLTMMLTVHIWRLSLNLREKLRGSDKKLYSKAHQGEDDSGLDEEEKAALRMLSPE
jgi:hypothetical protein